MSDFRKKIATWIEEVSTKNSLPHGCIAILVGLFQNETTYQAYLVGSNEYDPHDDDWACSEDFTPEPRYLDTGMPTDIPWEVFQGMVVDAIREVLANSPSSILHECPHVSVGFDDGELQVIK